MSIGADKTIANHGVVYFSLESSDGLSPSQLELSNTELACFTAM